MKGAVTSARMRMTRGRDDDRGGPHTGREGVMTWLVRSMLAGVVVLAAVAPARASNFDPDLESRLKSQLRESHYARIGIGSRTLVLTKPRVEPDGLAYEQVHGQPQRPAIITGADWDRLAAPPNPIPWSAIDRIESGKRHRRPSVLIGGGIGLLTGVLVGGFFGWAAEMSGSGDQTEHIVGFGVSGATLGMAIGAAFPKTRWVQVHPEPRDDSTRR